MTRISVILTLSILMGCTNASGQSSRISECESKWKLNLYNAYKLYQDLVKEFQVSQEKIIEEYRIEFGMYSEPRFEVVKKAAQKYPDRRWQMQSAAALLYEIDNWYNDEIKAANAWCKCQSGRMAPSKTSCDSMLPEAYQWPSFPDNWQNKQSPQTAYSTEYCKNFLSECERTSKSSGMKNPQEYCKCALEEVMKLYPSQADADNLTVSQLQVIAVKCNLNTMQY